MRWSIGGALVPDPLPLVDEILFGTTFVMGQSLCRRLSATLVVIDHNEETHRTWFLTRVKTTWSEDIIYVRCYKCGHEWIE